MAKLHPITPRRPASAVGELRFCLYADDDKSLLRAYATLEEAIVAASRLAGRKLYVKDRERVVWSS